MSAKNATQKAAKSTTATNKKSKGFTAEERAAMKERAQELKAEAAKADGEKALLEKVAEMKGTDKAMAKRSIKASWQPARGPLAEDLVRHARIRQGRQDRLLLQERREVQVEVRDVRLRGSGEPRRWRHVADLLGAQGADRRRREADHRAREEGGALATMATEKALRPPALQVADSQDLIRVHGARVNNSRTSASRCRSAG